MPHQFKTPRLANESVIVTPRVSSENRPYLPVGLMGLFCARKITTALQRLLRRVKNQGGCAARYWVLKRAPFRKLEFVCREEQWVDPIMYRHTASCERKAESKPKTKKPLVAVRQIPMQTAARHMRLLQSLLQSLAQRTLGAAIERIPFSEGLRHKLQPVLPDLRFGQHPPLWPYGK